MMTTLLRIVFARPEFFLLSFPLPSVSLRKGTLWALPQSMHQGCLTIEFFLCIPQFFLLHGTMENGI